jgi:FMN-dependent NADH-azoreductase
MRSVEGWGTAHGLLTLRRCNSQIDADEYVTGMAMHNREPPASFKLCVDQIVTPSTTLMRPLAKKRATFVIAAGAYYGPPSSECR